jgi:hypothetical protein
MLQRLRKVKENSESFRVNGSSQAPAATDNPIRSWHFTFWDEMLFAKRQVRARH